MIFTWFLHGCKFSIFPVIANSQYDQLSAGLIAKLIEHDTGIAEVMGSNAV